MKVVEQQRKEGSFIEVTLDDGTTVESPSYTDRLSLGLALHELARLVVKHIHEPAGTK